MFPDSLAPSAKRFPTSNIKLAAILLTMGFPFSEGMPCEIDLHAQSGQRRKRWWFASEINWAGAKYEAARIEKWFADKAEFEAAYPDHPVAWMRRALDWWDWLLRVKFKEERLKRVGSVPTFPTDDWNFGPCLLAAGYQLVKVDSNMLYFWDDGRCAKQYAQFSRPWNPEDEASKLPIIWRREALRSRQFLYDLIRSKYVIPMIHTKDRAGKHVLLPAAASRELKRQAFSQ